MLLILYSKVLHFELNFEQTHIVCMLCFDPSRSAYGQFDITDVEYEKLSARSQKFRNLSKCLKKHVQLESHQRKIQSKTDQGCKKGTERNREMGRRLGTLSYFIYYNNLPFNTFEKFMPWFSLNNIDMGEINHSVAFTTKFLESVSSVLRKRLRNVLDVALPCTNKPSPFAILGDKGTIKRNSSQPTLIRVATLRKQQLFQKYYMSHPQVISQSGEDITDLLLSSVMDTLGWSISILRQRFCLWSIVRRSIHQIERT